MLAAYAVLAFLFLFVFLPTAIMWGVLLDIVGFSDPHGVLLFSAPLVTTLLVAKKIADWIEGGE